jgi:glutamine synthetase
MIGSAEYIWLDGTTPTQELRSKTRIVKLDPELASLADFPEWSYDGSSTNQAKGGSSDLELRPVCVVADPIRGLGSYLVLCEVFNPDGSPHLTNTRSQLRHVLDAGGSIENPFVGFEQEYTLFKDGRPLGWPEDGFPGEQGPYYCGVGTDKVYGRDLVEDHLEACIAANLLIYGINAEVMPAQWEFQIGYRGLENDRDADPLTCSDHMWIAKWLLHRISEAYDITVSYANKPIKGDWNGAGCHTNISTEKMRQKETGNKAIDDAVSALGLTHDEHISVYGESLGDRLTGAHETCSISDFKAGVSDRGCSIRIPLSVARKGYGYIEDRRPGANADPYQVCTKLVSTICNVKELVLV